jgi:hypothetical protein
MQHTCEYVLVEMALHSLWRSFVALDREMKAYEPRSWSDFAMERNAEFDRMKQLNPTHTDESLYRLIDQQLSWRLDNDFALTYTDRFMAQYVQVLFVSHALCEAYINAALALGLSATKQHELFTLVERAEIKEKWRIGPQAFLPEYELPKGEALYESLTKLVTQRNALVHHKVEISSEGIVLLQGTSIGRCSFEEYERWERRFFSLPDDLLCHLRGYLAWDSAVQGVGRQSISPIVRAHAHEACLKSQRNPPLNKTA